MIPDPIRVQLQNWAHASLAVMAGLLFAVGLVLDVVATLPQSSVPPNVAIALTFLGGAKLVLSKLIDSQHNLGVIQATGSAAGTASPALLPPSVSSGGPVVSLGSGVDPGAFVGPDPGAPAPTA